MIKANATHHVAESILVNTDEYAEQPTNGYLATQPIVEGSLAPFYCDASMVSTAGEVGGAQGAIIRLGARGAQPAAARHAYSTRSV